MTFPNDSHISDEISYKSEENMLNEPSHDTKLETRRSEADSELLYDSCTDANAIPYLPQPTDFHMPQLLGESLNTGRLKSNSYPSDLILSNVRRNVHSKRRREINREASKRYRQRLKQKSLQTRQDLSLVISAYEQSKSAYEKAEHAFDVLKNIVLDLINIVPRN
ncbi:unnamed protein product [Schistosoma margrebowiei]|uniref:Uncharacterized protein n=1 Tax=Schistosoma margrebowiei TaxID=48269 RepID=A0A183N8L1_9TREM|nr:unnamed protein product [Schistosoma margrebowiei]